mmetsp:Transcript_67016/g.111379  ORF Transcript_67016/g.111379 Transcript_67016/m.111379 type:complete len:172 (-) Transcript_67016:227-742(-)
MWFLSLAAPTAPSCVDSGPWPCREQGCPPSGIAGCDLLTKVCHKQFRKVWDTPPDALDYTLIREQCLKTCNHCDELYQQHVRHQQVMQRATARKRPHPPEVDNMLTAVHENRKVASGKGGKTRLGFDGVSNESKHIPPTHTHAQHVSSKQVEKPHGKRKKRARSWRLRAEL